jgi:hypothetical protein
MRFLASLLLGLATALSQAALAQEPPSRVGRLAYAEGSVAIYQDPDAGWEKAYINSPVTSENSIWTDPNSRAEMRVAGMALRLDETTQLDIAMLDQDDLRAFLGRGSVSVRVRHFNNSERLDFATPHARFRFYGVGRYRLDVDPDRDETLLTVFSGSASMRSASGDIKVAAGGAVLVHGGPSPAYYREPARSTAFDRWTLARDERWIERRSTLYVSTDMTGYEDLDAYGEWYEEPQFGAIWFPSRVSRDWAPYRHGHWAWVRPWGWTWIADEPWGYAPYHYGRWVYVRNRWGWYPGERVANPVWAPALVAWVGGANFSVGISSGRAPAVGWYPLAPWERYEPWYRTNTTYVTRVNRVVRDRPPPQWEGGRDRSEWRYANRDRGATVVRRDAFASGTPVTQAMVPVTREVIQQAQVAPPTNLLPGREEFRRSARVASQPPAMQPGTQQAPATATAPQTQQQAEAPFRRGERGGPSARPDFERRQAAPAPAPATAAQQQQQQQAPAAAPGSPFARDDQRTQERAAREQQQTQERAARERQQGEDRASREQQQAQERAAREAQQQQQRGAQERAQREAQQAQERAAREQQQTQERAARETQQQQRQQQQAQERAEREAQQQQQRGAQERAQREAQQAQERAARETQQQQRQQQQAQERAEREAQQQQQRGAQERAQREAQQAQERAAREQQQTQERAAREAQQQQRQQQQAQERAAREAQQQQQAQERAAREAQQQAQQQQQAQERAAREAQQQAQQQQQRQAQERAQREAQQAQERAQREAQQAQERAARQPPAQAAAPAPAAEPAPAAAPAPAKPEREPKGKGRDRDEDEEKEKEKGRGKGRN